MNGDELTSAGESSNITVVFPEAAPEDDFKGPEFRKPKSSQLRQAKAKVLEVLCIKQSSIKCTACSNIISILDKSTITVHPILKVLVCQKCSMYYYSGEFLQDENGIDEHCRWCGEGGNVLLCDDCSNVFCRNCVRKNFGREYLTKVADEDNWLCFVCNPNPLKPFVSLARDVLNACDELDKVISQQKIEPKYVSPLKIRKDDSDGYFVNSKNPLALADEYEIVNSPKSPQDIPTSFVNGFESGSDLPNNTNAKGNTEPNNPSIKLRIHNNKILNGDKDISYNEKSESETEKTINNDHEKENNVPEQENYSSLTSNPQQQATARPRTFKSRGKDFRKLLKEREKEMNDQEENLSDSDESFHDAYVNPPNEEDDKLLLATDDEVEDFVLTQPPKQVLPESPKFPLAESPEESMDLEADHNEEQLDNYAVQSPEPPFSLSKWITEFNQKFKDASNIVYDMHDMVKKLQSYDESFVAASGQNKAAVNKRSPFKFKLFKITSKSLKKISKMSQTLIESRDMLIKKKSKLLENRTVTISESSDESCSDSSPAKHLFKLASSSPQPTNDKFADLHSSAMAKSDVENDSESILSNLHLPTVDVPPIYEDNLKNDEDFHLPEADFTKENTESVSKMSKERNQIFDKTGEDSEDLIPECFEDGELTLKKNEELPSTTHVDDELPSTSHVDDELPSSSHVDEELPSKSHVDEELPSTSYLDVELPSTSYLDDELPSTVHVDENKMSSTCKQDYIMKDVKVRIQLLSDKNIEDIKKKLMEESRTSRNLLTSDISDFSSSFSNSDEDIIERPTKKYLRKTKSMKNQKPINKSKNKKTDDEDFHKSDISFSTSSDEFDSESDYFNDSDDDVLLQQHRDMLSSPSSSGNALKEKLLQDMIDSDDASLSSDSDVDNLLNRDNTDKVKKRHKSANNDDDKSSRKKTDIESEQNEKYVSHPLLKNFKDSSDENLEPPVTRSKLRKRKRSCESEKKTEGVNKKTKRRILSDSDSDLTVDSSEGESKSKDKLKKERKKSSEDSEKSSQLQSSLKSFLKGSEEDSDEFVPLNSQKKKKRKRVKVKDSDEDSEDVIISCTPGSNASTPASKIGRKNIRKIQESSQTMMEATAEEWKRRERIKEQEKQLAATKQVVIEDDGNEEKTITRMFLSKNPDVEVDVKIVKHLKKHQEEGVRFLWNNVIENVKKANEKGSKGSGCILAHCMGLGKTLQSITFLNTVLLSPHLPTFRTALIICPKGTVSNWENEFNVWLSKGKGFRELRKKLRVSVVDQRIKSEKILQEWQRQGGVVILGYGLYRSLMTPKQGETISNYFIKTLRDPGPDIVICDEGHLLKNPKSNLQTTVSMIKTRRKIILTGTPLQNNLSEYHCMVTLVKPGLLGSITEFRNQFMNPIDNGQTIDSTPRDVKLMKKRAHILNQLLKGCVQRKDFTSLTKDLKPKYEYVISVRLSAQQIHMYRTFLGNNKNFTSQKKGLFSNFNTFLLICSHPYCLKLRSLRKKKREELVTNDSDCDGFIISSDEDEVDDEEEENEDDEEIMKTELKEEPKTKDDIKKLSKRALKLFIKQKSNKLTELKSHSALVAKAWLFLSSEHVDWSKKSISELKEAISSKGGSTIGCTERSELVALVKKLHSTNSNFGNEEDWFEHLLPEQENLAQSVAAGNKMVLLLSILEQACELNDKVVIFSQSLLSLTMIEYVLANVTSGVERGLSGKENKNVKYCRWQKNHDYFRLDGSTHCDLREKYIKKFNDESEARLRLFLISTRAGGIGINLTGANRAILFDASWNPSHDIQSLFRIYRFGQKKACYVYRLIAQGTMEEKIYERQVVKQSLSYRVVDEQQVDRHFSSNDIAELYEFNPTEIPKRKHKDETPRLAVPKDDLLARLFKNKIVEDTVVKYHEHDTLLDNQWEEDLTQEERIAAWEEYDREKSEKRRVEAVPDPNSVYSKLSLETLSALETKLTFTIHSLEKSLLTIKIPEFSSAFTLLKLKHRAMSTEEGNKLALQDILAKTMKMQKIKQLKEQIQVELVQLRKWITTRVNEQVKLGRTFLNSHAKQPPHIRPQRGANLHLPTINTAGAQSRNFLPYGSNAPPSMSATNNIRVRYPGSRSNQPRVHTSFPSFNNGAASTSSTYRPARPANQPTFRFQPYAPPQTR